MENSIKRQNSIKMKMILGEHCVIKEKERAQNTFDFLIKLI